MTADEIRGILYDALWRAGSQFLWRGPEGFESVRCTLVAVDATSGKMKWHFQAIHHDIWDWDRLLRRGSSTSFRTENPSLALAQATKSDGCLFSTASPASRYSE
jgi:quinoprotein glucose dehydrogenase